MDSFITLAWEPTTFIFSGFNPTFLGIKTFIFPWVLGVQDTSYSTFLANMPASIDTKQLFFDST